MDRIVVSVAEGSGVDLAAVVSALRDAGMVVDGVLEASGVVTGSFPAGSIRLLGTVPGVSAVEVDRTVGLPPTPGA